VSPRILQTTVHLPTETLTLEAFDGMDGQGVTDYGSPVEFAANVMEQAAGRGFEFLTLPDGSQVRTPFTLYVRGDESNAPREQDRVVIDSRNYIVVERTAPRGLAYGRDEVDHYRLRVREE